MNRNIEKALEALKQRNFLKKLGKKACFEVKYAFMYLKRFYWGITTKVEKGKILFLTFQGTYTCNPKYICEALIKSGYQGKLVWVVDNMDDKEVFPSQVQLVLRGGKEYYKALYSSNIWIDNAFNVTREPVWKKKRQIYIETMHGALGIKRIGPAEVKNHKRNKRGFDCGRLSDYIISNSLFEEQVYRDSFWQETEILRYGHARNDILLTEDKDVREKTISKVRAYFDIPDSQKIVLYAPTFKECREQEEELDYSKLKQSLQERFGGSWVVIERQHHRDRKKSTDNNRTVLDGNQYPDIQELMLAAEIGITDYSSWIFDFVLLRKPGFLYIADAEQYEIERGFYYPLEETPFLLAHSNLELEKAVLQFDENNYNRRITNFLQLRGCYENGKASDRIVDKINKMMEEYR